MKVYKLEEVISHMKNGINVKQNKNGAGVKLSRIETISDTNFNFDKVGFAELSIDQKSKYKIKKNDILFSHINSLEHLGKTAIYDSNEEIYHGVNLLLIKANDLVHSKYLRYFFIYLRSSGYWIKNGKQAINQASVNQTDIKNIPIPVPSLEEQEKIVERLDKVFKNIDKASVAKENEMLSLTNLFDSFLDNTIEEFGESEQKLGEYYDVRDGTHDSPKYYEKGYPLITSKNLKDGQLNFEKIKFISEEDFNKINKRSKVNKGDVLMAMIGTIGNPVIIKDNSKFAIKNVALFKLNNNQSSEYLYYFLRSNKVKKKMIAEAKGTTQKFVGLVYLRNFTITGKFDLNAENEVVFLISKIENIVNKLINNQQQIYTKLLELKESILNKEFSYE